MVARALLDKVLLGTLQPRAFLDYIGTQSGSGSGTPTTSTRWSETWNALTLILGTVYTCCDLDQDLGPHVNGAAELSSLSLIVQLLPSESYNISSRC